MNTTDYGTVEHEGKTYHLAQVAYMDNVGTDGDVAYYAFAVDDEGNGYTVIWDTTDAWDKGSADYNLALALIEDAKHHPLDDEETAEYKRLTDEGFIADGIPYCPGLIEDESNACDWDNPIAVNPR